MKLLLISILSLLVVGCYQSQLLDDPRGFIDERSCVRVEYLTPLLLEKEGERSFRIEEGHTYCFPDGNLLSVDSIANELCPCEYDCDSPGEVAVYGRWETPDGEQEFRVGTANLDQLQRISPFIPNISADVSSCPEQALLGVQMNLYDTRDND